MEVAAKDRLRRHRVSRLLFNVASVVLCRLIGYPIYVALAVSEPALRVILIPLSVFGIFTAVVLELSGSAPHFPLVSALALFAICGLVPSSIGALLRGLARLHRRGAGTAR